MAINLLRRIDGFNLYANTAREFIKEGIPVIIRTASLHGRQEHDLYRVLRHIRIPENTTLRLRLPSEKGIGDVSRFQLFDTVAPESEPLCREKEIIYSLTVDKTVFGAWDVYLFSKASNILPTSRHGAYGKQTLLFDTEDFNTIILQRGRCRDVIFKGDDLKPRVQLDGDKAIVESCIWTEWGGLYRETYEIEFSGNHISSFEMTGRVNLYHYDCRIRF